MWKYRQYVKYMAWHFQWIFITVICYMPALMVHIVNTLGFDSCLLVYVRSYAGNNDTSCSQWLPPCLNQTSQQKPATSTHEQLRL
mmetsp:Transcript_28940/g.51721  ORF Transcript_28940/g.51721 Transcript_28940/m.51721 type:complete len:85 (+) Transcript_28940:426-680(+)